MIINIEKNDEDITLKMIINEKEETFDYVNLINKLHEKEKIEKISFSSDIDEWEKEEINKLIDDINNAVSNTDDEKKEV